jgi:hypothetical protein
MSFIAIDRKVAPPILVFKAVLFAGMFAVWTLVTKRGGKDLELTVFYMLPFVIAICVPTWLTDFAAGLSLGAAVSVLPLTVFFGTFGGSFADPRRLLFMRLASTVLFAFAIAATFAYRRSGESSARFYSAAVMSIVYVLLLAATSG